MDSLRYNIRWVQRTFPSPSSTEALLSPERDAGTITPRDYDASVAFFPGPRRYQLVGGALGVPAYFMLPKQFKGTPRGYAVVMSASMIGYMVGQAMSAAAHVNFVKSIEDPIGFAQAMDNIQKQSGLPVLPGPTIVRQGKALALENAERNKMEATDPDVQAGPRDLAESPTPDHTGSISKPAQPTRRRWDEIRQANAGGARNSTWDAIRESHERSKVPTSRAPPAPNNDFGSGSDYDRRRAQAEFDELLQRERNFKG